MAITLNELPQLRDSGFGRPRPRHGLNLLYWFAHDYIDFSNGEIFLRFRPQNGDFGFHKYHNRINDDELNIVPTPTQNLTYYEVGNLNYPGADNLPNYVRANYNRNLPDSNKDRIIVRLDANGRLNRVYVTEHSDPKRFDKNKTFRVSQGLLQKIKKMSRENYLSEVSNSNTRDMLGGYKPPRHERASENDSWCAIL